MKIATYNVNSLRKRLPIVLDWLKQHRPDVMCLQETKVEDFAFPKHEIEAAGYHMAFRGMKTFNGVATLTKEKPESISYGFSPGKDADDFRLILAVVQGIPILNTYVPQGTDVKTPKFEYKLAWFKRLTKFFEKNFDPKKPAIWLGDLNVAPEERDVYDPVHLITDPDFHPAARAAYKQTVAWGFVDVFRKLYPDAVQYTYWDFFRNHFARDRGWRIDHILATAPLAKRCISVQVDRGPRAAPSPSDHTVLWAEFETPPMRRKR
jgi:exodeoxyribonuclease-3